MKPQLRYLIIIRPDGLPVYSQSFDFETIFACQTFGNRLTEVDKNKELVGGYLQIIKDMFSSLIMDKLRLINLEFDTYRITGLVSEGLLFIGIFEILYNEQREEEIILHHLRKISKTFVEKYQHILLNEKAADISKYGGFAKDLMKMGLPISMQKCRNCLINCTDKDMGCLPHLVYFKDMEKHSPAFENHP
ncbi:MAG: hypothetical protein ACFFCQ_11620 [Promethearchaeota archaeon]